MFLFGNNFLHIRNNHIIPLVNYGISKSKVKCWSFKDIISQNIISLTKLSGSSVELEIGKNDYYKALHCDIELFMNKSIVQYADFLNSKKNSPCWSFVTLYYLAFFSSTCLFRFLDKGFIFLNEEQIKRINDFSIAMYSEGLALKSGNYYFYCKNESENGNIILSLSHKSEGVHKLNWIQLENTFRNFLPYCDDDEKAIFNIFLQHFSIFNPSFPSNLRNKLNYNGESSILDIEGHIDHADIKAINMNFIKSLSGISLNIDIKNQIDSIAHLTSYLFKFNSLLYDEYLNRSVFGKDFSKNREVFLKKNTP